MEREGGGEEKRSKSNDKRVRKQTKKCVHDFDDRLIGTKSDLTVFLEYNVYMCTCVLDVLAKGDKI